MNKQVIITDPDDEQKGTSIYSNLGIRSTVQAVPKPSFNEWTKSVYLSTRQITR